MVPLKPILACRLVLIIRTKSHLRYKNSKNIATLIRLNTLKKPFTFIHCLQTSVLQESEFVLNTLLRGFVVELIRSALVPLSNLATWRSNTSLSFALAFERFNFQVLRLAHLEAARCFLN